MENRLVKFLNRYKPPTAQSLHLWVFGITLFTLAVRADNTWVYCVQLHATTQETPPTITLNWRADPYGAKNYTVYRKSKETSSWGEPVAALPGSATSYTDVSVEVGRAYEYQVFKQATLGYTGSGFIYAGMRVPMIENRGGVLLVIESSAEAALPLELDRLKRDLIGDGWQVASISVSSNDSPPTVRQRVHGAYVANPELNTLFLFGHVPILQSGNINWDTHGRRPVPADAYYGDMDYEWPTAPKSSPSYMPTNIELMVGRVDFFGMRGIGSLTPWPSEIEMLRNYLEKDHKWRHKLISVPRRALMGNGRGDESGGMATSGYRNFEPLVGPGNTIEADVSYNPPFNRRWISMLSQEPYLWAYGCGGGSPNGCGALGTNVVNGVPGTAFSRDVVATDSKAVFVLLFGSWFGNWDGTDNFMRSFLATKTMGLASALAGWPHWFVHHLSLGETLGYGTRLTMNNSSAYRTYENGEARAAYIALMGDPTLRMEPVSSPSNASAFPDRGSARLTWAPSTDPVLGYHVYRANSVDGPFIRVSEDLITETSFVDHSVAVGTHHYMIRAVALQENPSGTYYNPSQGVFASVTIEEPFPASDPIQVFASLEGAEMRLTWTSTPGATYYLLTLAPGIDTDWKDISGPIKAIETSTSWEVPISTSLRQRMYRIVSW